ncbi:MAG: helix-turn-helix domain-containing protein [Verrucomicrobiales bacterium]|nr:helix-turn-helix domain-containing protein [Verrucomicrobiales bacterium]MCP5556842.1 helix-turn-helix domain-containing protein [Verrucomicrobiaceae bacterium]
MHSVYQFNPARDPFSPYGFSCQMWQPTLMPRPDRHNELEINFLLSGSVTYLMGGRRTTIRGGCIALFWAAIPHQIVDWEGEEPYFVVTLPLGWFLATGVSTAFAQAVLEGELVMDARPMATDKALFEQWEADLRAKDEVRERAALLEIQARLLRLAEAQPKATKSRRISPHLSRADQLACHIAQNYYKPLTAEGIAKASGLHPNYAMNLFRQAFGTTMNDFITQHRLSHAQRLLLTTDGTVAEIAFDSGFQSLSRFNEAFKKSCGTSPRDYRKLNGKG